MGSTKPGQLQLQLQNFLCSMGYLLAASTEWNLFFVDGHALAPGLGDADGHSVWSALVRALSAAVAGTVAKLEAARARLTHLEGDVSEASAALWAERERAKWLEGELQRQQAEVQLQQSELAALYASTSWRVTAPLRILMGSLRAS